MLGCGPGNGGLKSNGGIVGGPIIPVIPGVIGVVVVAMDEDNVGVALG